MTTTPSAFEPARRFLPAFVLLFVGSGCAALVYEIVWFQMLALCLGSSAVSLAVLLGVFMGGMCLGSLLLPRFVAPHHHPLRVYAALEAAIGVLGLAILVLLPVAGNVYDRFGGPGVSGLVARGLIAAVCLLPPTLLMGATLPAIARYVESTPRGVAWLGFFYGANIAGAVVGCLVTGFYLLRVHDVAVATGAAVAINLAVAAIALVCAAAAPRPAAASRSQTPEPHGGTPAARATGAWPVYLAIAASGMTALGSEVVWTRLLTLILGGTTYTFSLIMAAFLTGLGIGSCAGSALAKSVASPRTALGTCQLLVMVAIGWAAYS
ncbi:MAG: SAM-dependent methyltransferase, partial [Planctomycetia bacterium]